MPAPTDPPTPQLFFETINAFQKTGALKAANGLVLEVVAVGHDSHGYALILGRDERIGVVEREGEGLFDENVATRVEREPRHALRVALREQGRPERAR